MKSLQQVLGIFFVALSLILGGCASRKILTEHLSHELLFPAGTYKHRVKLVVAKTETSEAKEFSFSGIVQISPQAIQIVVLSPFNTTLAKIHEDRTTEQVDFSIYMESFKKFEPKFRDYYSILRVMLAAPQTPSVKDKVRVLRRNVNGLPDEMETLGDELRTVFHIPKYDSNGIPEVILIQHPKFRVEVKVSGYEI